MDLKIPFLIIDISILPFFSKIFGKAMYNRLNSYISKLQILNPNQYGFHKNHSTHLANIDMCNNITKSLGDGKAAIGIFIDISKAFDTVNHNI